eukprot:s1421_g10.t2
MPTRSRFTWRWTSWSWVLGTRPRRGHPACKRLCCECNSRPNSALANAIHISSVCSVGMHMGMRDLLQPRLLFTSGFLRALETCYPIAESLQTAPELHSDLHEEGGVFEGPRRGVRRESYPMHHGLNAERMREVLPSLKVTESVPEQGWWPGGVEQPAAATDRAHRCAEWLWKLAEEQGAEESRSSESPGAVVCVTHGLFMDRLLKALAGLDPHLGSVLFMSFNCAYWLVQLRLNHDEHTPRTQLIGHGGTHAIAVMAACNVVDHVPMSIRTGHSMCGISHCQPSNLALQGVLDSCGLHISRLGSEAFMSCLGISASRDFFLALRETSSDFLTPLPSFCRFGNLNLPNVPSGRRLTVAPNSEQEEVQVKQQVADTPSAGNKVLSMLNEKIQESRPLLPVLSDREDHRQAPPINRDRCSYEWMKELRSESGVHGAFRSSEAMQRVLLWTELSLPPHAEKDAVGIGFQASKATELVRSFTNLEANRQFRQASSQGIYPASYL